MIHPTHTWLAGLMLTLAGAVWAQPLPMPDNVVSRRPTWDIESAPTMDLGRIAFVDPAARDAAILEVAARLRRLHEEGGASAVRGRQAEFQEALLMVCDADVLPTLDLKTIAAVDDAIELSLNMDTLRRGGWDRLAYVWGFFNHDVTAQEIAEEKRLWDSLSRAARRPRYPQEVHVIDALCKPLAYYDLATPEETRRALESAMPLLKGMIDQSPDRGTAFHPPSHACLVLAPLYDRLEHSPLHKKKLIEQFGERPGFERWLGGLLTAARTEERELLDWEIQYDTYIGSYLANALLRFNARSTTRLLEETLKTYQTRLNRFSPRAIRYTERALIGLGDPERRREFETEPDIETLVWLARNGQGETRAYALDWLSKALQVEPERCLREYYRRKIQRAP